MQGNNHNGSGKDIREDDSSNVIPLRRREPDPPSGNNAPLINLPPLTKGLVLGLLAIHIGTLLVSPVQRFWLFEHFGFIPAYYSGALPFDWPAVTGILTFTLLHSGWAHVLMNTVMLAAFGAGLERWMGWRRMLVFIIACNVFALFVHFILNLNSTAPVIGASGAISGLFAAAIIMLQQRGGMAPMGRFGYWPLIVLWVLISVGFGMMGGPGGESIAWAAHVGGFLAGFILLKPVMRMRI